MTLDFLSGLLLAAVAIAVLVYAITQIIGDRVDLTGQKTRVSSAIAQHLANDAKPVNDHLIGEEGKVIARSDGDVHPMKVRLALEIWPARRTSPDAAALPVDTPVRVVAVDGDALVVEPEASDA
jgi:membrane protein implicated in regulation of membrane protease activity